MSVRKGSGAHGTERSTVGLRSRGPRGSMPGGVDFLGVTSARAADLSMFHELSMGDSVASEQLACEPLPPSPDTAETPEELANVFGTSIPGPLSTSTAGTIEELGQDAPEEDGPKTQPDEEAGLEPKDVVAPQARRRHGWTRKSLRVTEAVFLTVVGLFAALLLVLSAGPRFLPFEDLVVDSGSMTPTLPVGSVAIYRHETAAQVKVGQIILFGKPSDTGVVVTHRVYAIKNSPQGRYFETKGDANPAPDAWQVRARGQRLVRRSGHPPGRLRPPRRPAVDHQKVAHHRPSAAAGAPDPVRHRSAKVPPAFAGARRRCQRRGQPSSDGRARFPEPGLRNSGRRCWDRARGRRSSGSARHRSGLVKRRGPEAPLPGGRRSPGGRLTFKPQASWRAVPRCVPRSPGSSCS